MEPTAVTTTQPRYRPADVRRQQILDAAAALAVSDGLETTSIATVAAAAGVAKGAIYLHFASRGELIAGLQARVWAQMMERPRVVADDGTLSWVERLDAVVAHWMRFELDNQSLYHAVFHTVSTASDEPLVETRHVLSALLAGGVTAGEFELHGIETATVVEFLLHAYVGPCFHADRDQEQVIGDVQRLFRRAVGAADAGAVTDRPRRPRSEEGDEAVPPVLGDAHGCVGAAHQQHGAVDR